jgi:hypothetical protein
MCDAVGFPGAVREMTLLFAVLCSVVGLLLIRRGERN